IRTRAMRTLFPTCPTTKRNLSVRASPASCCGRNTSPDVPTVTVTRSSASTCANVWLRSTPRWYWNTVRGEKLFIDFAGKTLSYIDRDTGEEISCPVLVACLPFSDYAFAMAVPSQGTEDFLHG